jgi:hypothetical protein
MFKARKRPEAASRAIGQVITLYERWDLSERFFSKTWAAQDW